MRPMAYSTDSTGDIHQFDPSTGRWHWLRNMERSAAARWVNHANAALRRTYADNGYSVDYPTYPE